MAQEGCNLDKEEAEVMKPSSSSSSSPSPSLSVFLNSPQEISSGRPKRKDAPLIKSDEESQPSVRLRIRCSSCRKRLGLAGFRCRCGDLFCARHRYSETHNCSFDYKAKGREEISKANPLIRAAKIIKI